MWGLGTVPVTSLCVRVGVLTLVDSDVHSKYQSPWPASWETGMQVKKEQLEPDMEQTGLKVGKECVKAVYCHPAYLTYMQSASWEMLGWRKHKL